MKPYPCLYRLLQQRFWPALAIFVAAGLIALVFLAALPDRFRRGLGTDYRTTYQPVAHSILAGRGLVRTNGTPAITYPPGYPLILALVFQMGQALSLTDARAVMVSNVVLLALTGVLIYLLAAHFRGAGHGLLAALLWITYPLNLFFLAYPSPEMPFEVFLYGALLVFCWGLAHQRKPWRPLVLCGVLTGCAMLIRPIAIGLGFALALCFWFGRRDLPAARRIGLAALLLASTYATVLPWETWVYLRTHRVVLLAAVGIGNVKDGLTFGENAGYRHTLEAPAGVRQLIHEIESRSPRIRSYSDLAGILAEQFHKRPLAVLEFVGLKAVRSWYGTDSQRWEKSIALLQTAYLALVLCATIRAWRAGRAFRRLAVGVWVLVLHFWLVNIVSTTLVRYSVPSMALLFLLVPALARTRGGPWGPLIPAVERLEPESADVSPV